MKKIIKYIEKRLQGKTTLILSVALLVFACLFMYQCTETKRLKKHAENTATFLNSEISYYKNKLGQEVAQKEALFGQKESLDVLLSKQIDSTQQLKKLVKQYKEVKAAGNIIQVTRIDTVKVEYDNPIEFEFSKNWSVNDKYYFIAGRSTNTFTSVDTLQLDNTISFAIGKKKTGFWNTTFQAEVVNSNPFVKTTGLDTYSYTEKKKRFGIGPYIGIDFLTLQPALGLSLSFDLIQF
jgi:hypothetical protein